MGSIQAASVLGQKLASVPPELRVEALAARIGGGIGRLAWRRSRGELHAEVSAGEQQWALRTGIDTPVASMAGGSAKGLILQTMTVALVHEAVGCTCSGLGPAPCPAFMAFSRATEGCAAA